MPPRLTTEATNDSSVMGHLSLNVKCSKLSVGCSQSENFLPSAALRLCASSTYAFGGSITITIKKPTKNEEP